MKQLRWTKSELAVRIQEVLNHLHDRVELFKPIQSLLLGKQVRVGD